NVFLHQVPGEEVVKLVDFGIAEMVRGDEDRDTTRDLLLGSHHYLAPERWERRPHDGRADIYSLGVTMYEMLAGRRPFAAPTGRHRHMAPGQLAPPPL